MPLSAFPVLFLGVAGAANGEFCKLRKRFTSRCKNTECWVRPAALALRFFGVGRLPISSHKVEVKPVPVKGNLAKYVVSGITY